MKLHPLVQLFGVALESAEKTTAPMHRKSRILFQRVLNRRMVIQRTSAIGPVLIRVNPWLISSHVCRATSYCLNHQSPVTLPDSRLILPTGWFLSAFLLRPSAAKLFPPTSNIQHLTSTFRPSAALHRLGCRNRQVDPLITIPCKA